MFQGFLFTKILCVMGCCAEYSLLKNYRDFLWCKGARPYDIKRGNIKILRRTLWKLV